MTIADPYGLVGQILDGQFRVDRVIGEGGFSVVYQGRHVGLDEPVAIKCLKLQAQLGSAIVESFVRRFRDESKIHYRLSAGSLSIARTIAAGTTMAPATHALVPYMVLEWLDGFTLSEELRARRMRGEHGRPLMEVIRALDPVADAMAFAHAQGVVHRDLNPSNIFVAHVQGQRRLKVLDFGVAKVISDHALALGPRAQTLGMIRMFTPSYGAPEQFNESLGPISPCTDVYAFALLVVELLTDRTPVEGEHLGQIADLALDRARRPTPRALGVPVGEAVEAVMARALSVDPGLRPGDIGEFWGMLKNAAARDLELGRTPVPERPGSSRPPVDQLGATTPHRGGSGVPPTLSGPIRPAGSGPVSARSVELASTSPEYAGITPPGFGPAPPATSRPPPMAPGPAVGPAGTLPLPSARPGEVRRSTPAPGFAARGTLRMESQAPPAPGRAPSAPPPPGAIAPQPAVAQRAPSWQPQPLIPPPPPTGVPDRMVPSQRPPSMGPPPPVFTPPPPSGHAKLVAGIVAGVVLLVVVVLALVLRGR